MKLRLLGGLLFCLCPSSFMNGAPEKEMHSRNFNTMAVCQGTLGGTAEILHTIEVYSDEKAKDFAITMYMNVEGAKVHNLKTIFLPETEIEDKTYVFKPIEDQPFYGMILTMNEDGLTGSIKFGGEEGQPDEVFPCKSQYGLML